MTGWRKFAGDEEGPADLSQPVPWTRKVPLRPESGAARRADPRLVSLVAPASFEAEQYRTLRARLESRREGTAVQVMAVTSATVGDGKTTTAINLAGALAQSREGRVLLVDADLRRPSIGPLLGWGETDGPGLADAIVDPDLSLARVVRTHLAPNLGVVTAGRPPDAPYESLRSPRLGALFEEARRDYDHVIVDTPPLIPVPDSRLIARWVDGLILVVAAHRTPRKLLEEGLNLLDPDQVLGLVFNGDERPLPGYYGYARAYGRPSRRHEGFHRGSLRDPPIDGPRPVT